MWTNQCPLPHPPVNSPRRIRRPACLSSPVRGHPLPASARRPGGYSDGSKIDRVAGGYVGSGSPRAGFGRVDEEYAAAVDTSLRLPLGTLPNPAALRTRRVGSHSRTTNQSGNRRSPRHSRPGQQFRLAQPRSTRPTLRKLHPPAHLASNAQVNRPGAFTSSTRRASGRHRTRIAVYTRRAESYPRARCRR